MLEWIVNKLFGQKVLPMGYKPPRAPAQQRPAISFGFVADMTPSRSSILLKEATAKKKNGDWDGAISLLREAYAEIARTRAIEKPETFLRLPMYLQQAGRPNEAWSEFNAMLAGQYPLDMRDPAFAPLWQSQIYDKMRLFLEREKKDDKAVFFGVLFYLAYGKWLTHQAATEEFLELRGARRDEFREWTSTQAIKASISPLLEKAKFGHVTAELTRVVHHHLERGESLSLSQAHKDVNAVLSSQPAMLEIKPPRQTPSGGTHCPYCGNSIVPKPVRHRKCPQCGQPIRVRRGRLMTKAQEKQLNEELQRQRIGREQAKTLRLKTLTRESNLRTLQAARDLQRECPGGFGVEVQAMLDDETCDHCANLDGTIIRADQCTPESIPPWPRCTSESGCRCHLLTAFGLDMPEGNG